MKRHVMLLLTLLLAGSACIYAQKKEVKIFEEATARRIEPQVHVFITPQVADLKMLSTEREQYGPYRFEMKSLENTSLDDLNSWKIRALYRATLENNADAIIEPLFNCYVLEKDTKTMVIELSGFPVKYVNFRSLGKDDLREIEMIKAVYDTPTIVTAK